MSRRATARSFPTPIVAVRLDARRLARHDSYRHRRRSPNIPRATTTRVRQTGWGRVAAVVAPGGRQGRPGGRRLPRSRPPSRSAARTFAAVRLNTDGSLDTSRTARVARRSSTVPLQQYQRGDHRRLRRPSPRSSRTARWSWRGPSTSRGRYINGQLELYLQGSEHRRDPARTPTGRSTRPTAARGGASILIASNSYSSSPGLPRPTWRMAVQPADQQGRGLGGPTRIRERREQSVESTRSTASNTDGALDKSFGTAGRDMPAGPPATHPDRHRRIPGRPTATVAVHGSGRQDRPARTPSLQRGDHGTTSKNRSSSGSTPTVRSDRDLRQHLDHGDRSSPACRPWARVYVALAARAGRRQRSSWPVHGDALPRPSGRRRGIRRRRPPDVPASTRPGRPCAPPPDPAGLDLTTRGVTATRSST